ncbi:MAG: immune inhibitor A [Anaerolineales bacterium]|nr:immune inhibitor A [Anaerolineales bacterium]
MDSNRKIILIIVLASIACLCCLGLGGSSLVTYWSLQPIPTRTPDSRNYPVVTDASLSANTPGGPAETALPGGSVLALSDPVSPEALETFNALVSGDPPAGDLVEQAERLKGIPDIPRVVSQSAAPIAVGATDSFYVSNSDTDETRSVTARMRYATPHVYFWVDTSVTASDADIREVVDTFEEEIYPTDREFFGSEWSPGVDGDPHLYILWARGLGSNVAGYYSTADEVSRLAHPFSNQHEMFYMNADGMDLTDEYVMSVLAHEFQHMIHWNNDANEEGWVDEGFAELAVTLNGYSVGGADWVYLNDPDIQLNTWSDINDDDVSAHYGGSFLFMNYFLGRFGRQATQALVRNPANGLSGLDDVVSQLNLTNASGAGALTTEDVMAEFGAALLLQDEEFEDGRFGFKEYPDASDVGRITKISACPSETESKKVSQFGFDYYAIECGGTYTVYFAGLTKQKTLPVDPQDGKYYVWSNRGDKSDMTLTRAFDLPAGKKPTLEFDLWYDIEENWDYAYVEVSADGGKTWKILRTKYGTSDDPQGNSYGWGWTGVSEDQTDSGWATESVDLSSYAGKRVLVRFEYITDAAVNGEGLIIDNIRIPEIGYATDFEGGLDDWEARGFVRLQNVLPQSYRVLVVRKEAGISVEEVKLDDRMSGSLTVTAGEREEVYLIVLGTARYTRQKAAYQFVVLR